MEQNLSQNIWYCYGIHFGYPKCCINAFISRNEDRDNCKRPSRIQSLASNRSGFIPCSYCSWKVISKQCKLSDLISPYRYERIDFPNA